LRYQWTPPPSTTPPILHPHIYLVYINCFCFLFLPFFSNLFPKGNAFQVWNVIQLKTNYPLIYVELTILKVSTETFKLNDIAFQIRSNLRHFKYLEFHLMRLNMFTFLLGISYYRLYISIISYF
jgi:hypothetical protein